jgi:hypothetical protein
VELRPVRRDDPLMAPLIEGMTAEYEARYGEVGEMSMAKVGDFDPPGGVFLALFDDDGTLVAGGGLRRYSDDIAEIKRMWTAWRAGTCAFARPRVTRASQRAIPSSSR